MKDGKGNEAEKSRSCDEKENKEAPHGKECTQEVEEFFHKSAIKWSFIDDP